MPALHLKLNYETATFLDFQPYFPNKSEVAVMAAWEKTYPPNSASFFDLVYVYTVVNAVTPAFE